MNAIKLLKNDHHTVDQLFKKYVATVALSKKEEIAQKIIEELSVHASIEERYVYKPASERSPTLARQVLESVEEHDLVKTTLLHLEGLLALPASADRREPRMDAVVNVLAELVRSHVQDEQEVFFPELQRVMSAAELEAIGLVLVQAKATAPRFPRLPHPISAIARLVDRAVELARDVLGTATQAMRGI
jgi:hemerythrin-like domain-containing protein